MEYMCIDSVDGIKVSCEPPSPTDDLWEFSMIDLVWKLVRNNKVT